MSPQAASAGYQYCVCQLRARTCAHAQTLLAVIRVKSHVRIWNISLLSIYRWICSATPADGLLVQWNLWGSHHDHRLGELSDVRHFISEGQSLPVWSPRRLCGHAENHRRWTGHWSHHSNPYLHHHTAGWVPAPNSSGTKANLKFCSSSKEDVATVMLLLWASSWRTKW